ncbi:MAG: oxidoreductase [Gammaproteobacteria bacterium]|nr:oxidoreductase [Gammaproteobacteria bacterium]
MDYSDILDKFANELTSTQFQYLEKMVEFNSGKRVADYFDRNESSVRRSLTAIRKKFQLRDSQVPAHMTDPVPEAMSIKGTSTLYDQDGNRRMHWIKTERGQDKVYQDLVTSMEDLAEQLPKIPKRSNLPNGVDPDLMTVYPIGDPHIGLLCYEPEVGADWDLQIAEAMFLPLFDNLVTKAPPSKECLIIDLGDFWHYDAMDQRTTRSGHKVDADGRPSKMIQVGYRILLRMIESALSHHEIVHVKILPGNHDDLGSVFMRTSLVHIYANEPRVIVDQTPNVFQYHTWGNTLIGMHHGDKCKMNQLPMVMAADEPKSWGMAEYRYWMVGHFHHDSTTIHNGKEMQGCKVETFRTIVGREGYAHEDGYRSGQDGKALVIHKKYGEVERYTVNIGQTR